MCSQLCFANWSLKRKIDDISIYQSKNLTRLTVNYRSTKLKNKKFTKDLLNKIKKDKEKMLAMIGVTDWKVDKTDLNKKNGVTNIKLAGSYVDSSQEKIYFVEYHYYSKSKRLQILLTNPKKRALDKDAKPVKIEKFKGKYDI